MPRHAWRAVCRGTRRVLYARSTWHAYPLARVHVHAYISVHLRNARFFIIKPGCTRRGGPAAPVDRSRFAHLSWPWDINYASCLFNRNPRLYEWRKKGRDVGTGRETKACAYLPADEIVFSRLPSSARVILVFFVPSHRVVHAWFRFRISESVASPPRASSGVHNLYLRCIPFCNAQSVREISISEYHRS